jgi:hypothetical protein
MYQYKVNLYSILTSNENEFPQSVKILIISHLFMFEKAFPFNVLVKRTFS